MTVNPSTTRITGAVGENTACRYLERKGFTIIDRNVTCGRFEIDIVARKGNTLVFCEVKTARSRRFGTPASWVTVRKQKRIAEAASTYCANNPERTSGHAYRFDVIGLSRLGDAYIIDHIENAFTVPEEE